VNCPQKPACTLPRPGTVRGCTLRLLSQSAVLSVLRKATSTRVAVLARKPWAAPASTKEQSCKPQARACRSTSAAGL
jgi:hypothetical protein